MVLQVRFASNANPLILKNAKGITSSGTPYLINLPDVSADNKSNNSVLIYNSDDEKFHLDQLSLDGGNF